MHYISSVASSDEFVISLYLILGVKGLVMKNRKRAVEVSYVREKSHLVRDSQTSVSFNFN